MTQPRSSAPDDGAHEATASPDDREVDETLIDLMLEQSISDRLRTVCRYANALARFRPV